MCHPMQLQDVFIQAMGCKTHCVEWERVFWDAAKHGGIFKLSNTFFSCVLELTAEVSFVNHLVKGKDYFSKAGVC